MEENTRPTTAPIAPKPAAAAATPPQPAAPPVHPSFPIRTSALNAASEHLATLKVDASREDILKALDAVKQLNEHEKGKIIRQIARMPVDADLNYIRSQLST
jgi:hypothetical protein